MLKEMVIDYDSVTDTALLYSVDYDGGVGTLVPAEIADAPALVSMADIVACRVDKAGLIHEVKEPVYAPHVNNVSH